MRTPRDLLILAALALCLWAAPSVLADGPAGKTTQTVLEPLPATSQAPGQPSTTLSVMLRSSGGPAVRGEPVTFYVLTSVFGERLMNVGQVLTDAAGIASLVYKPTWEGEHTVVAAFGGDADYAPTRSTFQFSATGLVSVHEPAPFGLELIRQWLPLAVGAVVLAVWAVLGLIVVRTVVGIRALASTAVPVAGPMVVPLRPMPLRGALIALAVLALLAVPAAWLIPREGGEQAVSLSTDAARYVNGYGQEGAGQAAEPTPGAGEKALPVTLVRTVQLMTTDAGGQFSAGSADLPSDVAIIKDRVFVLDTNKGRILTVSGDGKLATMLESDQSANISLRGASAMAVHDGVLYVASPQAGAVTVISPPGRIEAVIRPQVPEGQRPLKLAGIAVTDRGDIWLSDADNHRVFLINQKGEFIGVIGEGKQAAGEHGFNTPAGLALDGLGNLYVVDTGNHEVKKYSPIGVFLSTIGADRLAEPKAVALADDGHIYVSDDRLMSVLAFGPDGSYLGSIGKENVTGKESRPWLQVPYGLRVDGSSLYVMDRLAGLFVLQLGDGSGR